MAPLGTVLTLQRRWVTPELDHQYTEIGVRSYGRGIFHKAPVTGADLGNKRVLRVEPGDLVLMNVFAWEGAVAVAGASEAGMIGSHRYATYTTDPAQCIPDFLSLYFKTEAGLGLLRKVSPGSAGRNRTLNLAQFIQQSVPLPPIEEQRRIVARVDAIAAKIEEAQRLREQASKQRESLIAAAVAKALGGFGAQDTLSSALAGTPKNGWSPRRDSGSAGTPILSLSAVTGFKFRSTEFKLTSETVAPDSPYLLAQGDLLITRSNTPELVGHVAIYDGQPSPCLFPDLMMRLPIDRQRADARFVYWWLRSTQARNFVRSRAKGTNPTMAKISQQVVMEIPMPTLPPLQEQRRLVAVLDRLQESIDGLSATQRSASDHLRTLLPAVLHRAFQGEL